jgi:hypothetical protein
VGGRRLILAHEWAPAVECKEAKEKLSHKRNIIYIKKRQSHVKYTIEH